MTLQVLYELFFIIPELQRKVN